MLWIKGVSLLTPFFFLRYLSAHVFEFHHFQKNNRNWLVHPYYLRLINSRKKNPFNISTYSRQANSLRRILCARISFVPMAHEWGDVFLEKKHSYCLAGRSPVWHDRRIIPKLNSQPYPRLLRLVPWLHWNHLEHLRFFCIERKNFLAVDSFASTDFSKREFTHPCRKNYYFS